MMDLLKSTSSIHLQTNPKFFTLWPTWYILGCALLVSVLPDDLFLPDVRSLIAHRTSGTCQKSGVSHTERNYRISGPHRKSGPSYSEPNCRSSGTLRTSGPSWAVGRPASSGNPVHHIQIQTVGFPLLSGCPVPPRHRMSGKCQTSDKPMSCQNHTAFIRWRAIAVGCPVIHRTSGACFATGRPVTPGRPTISQPKWLQRPYFHLGYKYPSTTPVEGGPLH